MADVVLVGVLAAQAGAGHGAGLAVLQGGLGFVRGAAPALQGVGGHLAVAAGIQAGIAAGQRTFIAGEHALGVIGGGVVEEAVLGLGQVQTGGGGGAGTHRNPVLDHVGLDAAHGRMGPAGAVGVLVLDGSDPALIAAVPGGGQRIAGGLFAHETVIRLHIAAPVRVGHGLCAVDLRGDVAGGHRFAVVMGNALCESGGRQEADHQQRGQKECQEFFVRSFHCMDLLVADLRRVAAHQRIYHSTTDTKMPHKFLVFY